MPQPSSLEAIESIKEFSRYSCTSYIAIKSESWGYRTHSPKAWEHNAVKSTACMAGKDIDPVPMS